MLTHNGPMYFISINPTTEHVTLTCIGMECVDSIVKDKYGSIDELPKDILRRVSMLFIPDKIPLEIAGVGIRSTPHTFWVCG